jgi:hypothetical protein
MDKTRMPLHSENSPDRKRDKSSNQVIAEVKSKLASASTSALVKDCAESDLSKSRCKQLTEGGQSQPHLYSSLTSRKAYKFSSSNGDLLACSPSDHGRGQFSSTKSPVHTDRGPRPAGLPLPPNSQPRPTRQAARLDLQAILASLKAVTTPKSPGPVFAKKPSKTDVRGEADLGRLKALVQSINATLAGFRGPQKAAAAPRHEPRKASERRAAHQASKTRVLEQLSQLKTHGKSTSSLVGGKETCETSQSLKAGLGHSTMASQKLLGTSMNLTRDRGSDSERAIGGSTSSRTQLLRKLSSTSMRRLGLKADSGFASTARLKAEESFAEQKAAQSSSRLNSSSASRGKVDLYGGKQQGGSQAALLLADALRAPYFDRLSAEGRKAIASSRALAHKDPRRHPAGNSFDSGHNLYTKQASLVVAPSK